MQLVNNFSTSLVADITNAQTSFDLVSVTGLPSNITLEDPVILTLESDTDIEVIKVTGLSASTITVIRAQESTSAANFLASSTRVEARLTARMAELLGHAGILTGLSGILLDSDGSILTVSY